MRLVLLHGLLLALALNFASSGASTGQSVLTPEESRGKQIYLRGTSASGKEILAYLGESSLELPGSAMACANCHGFDGQGKPEGGVIPTNLNWEGLTKPYGVTHADGRKHPPYTERGLELAITRGTDPAGNKLGNVMPRYAMSKDDLADLVVYLKRLGKDRDPGISDDKIVIGTALPLTGPLGEMGQAVKAVTTAFFTELNSQGGVYNRRVELKFVDTGATPAATRANLERLLKEEQVFALTATFMAGAEKELVSLIAEREVPLIGPLTLDPQTSLPLNRQVFYLLSGVDAQARALVDFASRHPQLKNARAAIVSSQNDLNAKVQEAIKDQSKKLNLEAPQVYNYPTGHFEVLETLMQLRKTDRDAVFFLGSSEELASFMKEADKIGWFPALVLAGGSVSKEVFNAPAGFDGKLFFSFPTSPADQTAEGVKEFRALAEKYQLPTRQLPAQMSAYSAARILAEGLKRVGKDLSRERLIQALEGFYEYKTGLIPSITYGPNRRIGALGAYVVTVDLKGKQFSPASGWINLN
jgi:ABC-type branched-subunit amino acid transport system substrate-binding protein